MKANVEQIKPLLLARMLAYDFLRKTLVMEPSLDYFKHLNEFGIENFPFVRESEQILEGVNLIKDYSNRHALINESVYNGLIADYTQLFIGPQKLPCPPWESAYMSEERLLFQEETLKVRSFYLKYGFIAVQFKSEADDHIGLELDFMFQLCQIALERLEAIETEGTEQFFEIISDQKQFHEQHFHKWVPRFSQDMAMAAKTEFYQGIAAILNGFLKLDLEAVEELLGIEL